MLGWVLLGFVIGTIVGSVAVWVGLRSRAMRGLADDVTRTGLEEIRALVGQLDQARAKDHGEIAEAVRVTQRTAQHLAGALRSPGVRGQWGEVQLARIVELIGFKDFCSFQVTVTDDDGMSQRPDCVIALPNGRELVIDAKVPLERFLKALETDDEEQQRTEMAAYGMAVRGHVRRLGAKAYQDQCPDRDFVVMYLPSEALFSAALQQDPELLSFATASNVILAGPAALTGLLRTVHVGWREQNLAANARQVADLGRQLYKRLGILGGHLQTLGRRLNGAVTAYNSAVGSLERGALVTARKFSDYGLGSPDDLPELEPLSQTARHIQAPELIAGATQGQSAETPALVAPGS
jgi:DNA recombination protein RmuC